MNASRVSNKLCTAVSLAIVLSSGCHSSNNRVSAEGVAKCKEETALRNSGFSSPEQLQASFRQCLRSIDQHIQLEHQSIQDHARKTARDQKILSDSVQEASVTDILKFCSSRKDEIKSQVQAYYEVSGRISQLNYSGSQSSEELANLESQQDQRMREIEALVPPDYRLNRPLIPDAVGLLMRCDQQEIISLDNN